MFNKVVFFLLEINFIITILVRRLNYWFFVDDARVFSDVHEFLFL